MTKRGFNELTRIVYQNMPDSENGVAAMHKIREAYHELRMAYVDLLATHLLHLVRAGDCDGGGTIAAACSDPIFGKKESARIMKADNVVGLDAVGYGNRLDNESDRRSCTIKYQF